MNREPTTSRRDLRDQVAHLPKPNARFFYLSPLPIDDPLSPVPPHTQSTAKTVKHAPRPFSAYDNALLDQAWNRLQLNLKQYHRQRDLEKRNQELDLHDSNTVNGSLPNSDGESRRPSHSDEIAKRSIHAVHGDVGGRDRSARGSISSIHGAELAQRALRHQRMVLFDDDPIHRQESSSSRSRAGSAASSLHHVWQDDDIPGHMVEDDMTNIGTSGTPFLRAPSRSQVPVHRSHLNQHIDNLDNLDNQGDDLDQTPFKTEHHHSEESAAPRTTTPVGVSRLHQVTMPDLNMEPIYWKPVHDIAPVIRATWFYEDSMLPVEVDVANQLERGWLTLQPWTQTWQDELDSAVEAGASGEMKIAHTLWPHEPRRKSDTHPVIALSQLNDQQAATPEQERETVGEETRILIDHIVTGGEHDHKAAGDSSFGRDGQSRWYPQASVIFADDVHGFLLRPNLQPSTYYGRRPLANYIRKGHSIGIGVVRGFDQKKWDQLHPPKRSGDAVKAQEGVSTSQAGRPLKNRLQSDPSLAKSAAPVVKQLILVVHGIGQKLSERVESYHFTHVTNSLRREINVELGSQDVKTHLRKDHGGIMVLPCNWRSSLSFEEGGYRDTAEDSSGNRYSLEDITPESLPSVRSIISDVMLDIPYYLSHHQPVMIKAVIREANRVYRLWCKNNPGFDQYGSVHLVCHSLGSVMAIDILSKQPTNVAYPEHESSTANDEHFAFDTKNLYLCGSPAGFFLLLKKAALLPRRGIGKDDDDSAPGVAGEQGVYGCVAVENIYNIINPYDPVAYRLNATVDATYAASLKTAWIPSASTSWFSFGNPFRSSNGHHTVSTLTGKPSMAPRLPSQVELEVHDFTQEEIAERRVHLLNDNGQIDFYMRYGGGPLDIQYLTMLGAHSSYWLSRDFVRFICVETGREPGRAGALPAMRALKKKLTTS